MDAKEDQKTDTAAIRREVAVVFGLSVALTAGVVGLGLVVPWVGQNALGFVALVFLYLPILVLRRRNLDPARYGLRMQGWGRGVLFGLGLTLVTLPPFLVGFHLWETVVFIIT